MRFSRLIAFKRVYGLGPVKLLIELLKHERVDWFLLSLDSLDCIGTKVVSGRDQISVVNSDSESLRNCRCALRD